MWPSFKQKKGNNLEDLSILSKHFITDILIFSISRDNIVNYLFLGISKRDQITQTPSDMLSVTNWETKPDQNATTSTSHNLG